MVKNRFTKKQKVVLNRICEIQLESLTRTYREKRYKKALEELKEAGVDVSALDFDMKFIKDIKKFTRVRTRLNDLYMILDESEIGIIKHILFNFEDSEKKVVKNIFRKLFLSDKVVMSNMETLEESLTFKTGKFNFNITNN